MQALPKGWTAQEYEWLQALGQARTATERQQLLQQHREWLQPAWVERLQQTLSTEAPGEAQAWLMAAQGLRIAADTLQDARLKAFTRLRLALLYLTLYELDSAMRWVQESLALFRKMGNQEGMALCLHLQADILAERGDLSQAIRLMQQALPLYQRTGKPEQQARGELGIGRFYAMAGEPERALNHLRRALPMARQAKSLELQAVIEMTQGIALRALGRFDEALQTHGQALELFRQLNRLTSVAKQLANIGLVYWSMGLTQEARWHYQQAMPLFKQLNLQQDVAICLMNTVLLLQDEGELERAIETCKEALRMSESLNDEIGIAFCNSSLADMLHAVGRYWEAMPYADRAIRDAQRIGLKQVALQTQVLRARLLHEMGRYPEAERMLNQLLKQLHPVENRVELINALLLLGEGARRQGNWKRADQFYQRCLQQIERLHGLPSLPPEELSRALQKVRQCISRIACAYAAVNQPERAFAICQQGKGIGLRLAIESRRQPIAGLPSAEARRLSGLRQQLERAEQQLMNARTARERRQAQQAYKRAFSEWSRTRLNLARRYRRYRIVQPPIRLQQLPLSPETALVEYVQMEKAVAIVVVRREGNRNRVRATLVQVAESRLQQVLDQLYRGIEQGGDLLPIHQTARQLYNWLVAPVANELRGVRHVILCADGVLHRVPWTVLQTPDGRYWTEQVAITQVVSASVWASLPSMKRSLTFARPLMVAISQFPQSPASSPSRARLAPLPGVQQEQRLLVNLLGDSLQVVSEGEATPKRVRTALPRASQIHFATHAVPNPQQPLLSALALYGSTAPEWLYAYEVLSLPLQAQLVVLSACSTAGDALTGDGLMGLTWAFLAAGCSSVVATLWKLPDEGVPLWMEVFYRALKQGQPVANAVRQANLRLLKHPRYAHPRYWAGWAAFGKE